MWTALPRSGAAALPVARHPERGITMTEPRSPADLMAMSDLITPMVLRVAATLRLADHVGDGAVDVAALAGRAGVDRASLRPLVRHLVAIDVLDDTDDGLRLTDLGALLREDAPGRCRSLLDIDGAVGRAELAFSALLAAVRTGRPAYETLYGRGFWEDVYADAALAGSLDALRTTAPSFDANLVIDGYDWDRVAHVVDVGGGNGALLGGLLRAHRHLRGTLVDLPPAAAAAEVTFDAVEVADRARAVGGSFFDPLPAGGDVYLLSGVLFDWDDEQARTILGRCAEAARPGGTVLVSEISLDAWGERPDSTTTLRMTTMVPSRERSDDAIVGLGAAAGLSVVSRTEPTPFRSLLEFAVA